MSKAILLLGSNIENRKNYLEQAINAINDRIGKIVTKSSIYETVPWGFEHETNFYNQVIIVETLMPPQQILSITQYIEGSLGRIRTGQGYAARTIDIDILFYDEIILSNPDLIIPHPHLQERRFALEPLNEICTEFIHPVFQQTISTLLKNCADKLNVVRIK